MRAADLRLEELVSFEEGKISLPGRRLVLHSLHAMAQFRRDLVDMLGTDGARRLLTRFGYFWGQADAAAMRRLFEWDNVEEWLRAGTRMHALQGVARVIIHSLDVAPEEGRFDMQVAWHDSGEAEEHLLEFGRSPAPVCWMLVGYASGYATFCMGRPVYFIERACHATGEPACVAVGRDDARWGDEIEPHKAFFEGEDIQAKVRELTDQLRRRTRELERERRRLARLERLAAPPAEAHSEAFRRVVELATRVARYNSSVLITGETGTGKEVLARHIHRCSARAKRPFLAVNCAALPDTLLESELFGHAAGAFTGAVGERRGLFEQAAGGTLFLDEIGDISPAMQVRLLRALQERQVLRLGENVPRPVDVRVIAATNRDLPSAIQGGRFREDLYYRLAVIEIHVPPLRERREDILALARHFVKAFGERLRRPELRLDASCLDALLAYPWPGNVRELENAIERAAVLTEDGRIRREHLPPSVRAGDEGPVRVGGLRSLAEVEQEHIENVLRLTDGNRSRAARVLGISPSTLWRRLRSSS